MDMPASIHFVGSSIDELIRPPLYAGTGTFGRVRLVKGLQDNKYMALKILKKSEVIRLKQVEHIKSEISLLKIIQHPFVVNL